MFVLADVDLRSGCKLLKRDGPCYSQATELRAHRRLCQRPLIGPQVDCHLCTAGHWNCDILRLLPCARLIAEVNGVSPGTSSNRSVWLSETAAIKQVDWSVWDAPTRDLSFFVRGRGQRSRTSYRVRLARRQGLHACALRFFQFIACGGVAASWYFLKSSLIGWQIDVYVCTVYSVAGLTSSHSVRRRRCIRELWKVGFHWLYRCRAGAIAT